MGNHGERGGLGNWGCLIHEAIALVLARNNEAVEDRECGVVRDRVRRSRPFLKDAVFPAIPEIDQEAPSFAALEFHEVDIVYALPGARQNHSSQPEGPHDVSFVYLPASESCLEPDRFLRTKRRAALINRRIDPALTLNRACSDHTVSGIFRTV